MQALLIITLICITTFFSCTERKETVVIVPVAPQLPKIDCEEYYDRVAADIGARGLQGSGVAQQIRAKAIKDCTEENRRRGY